ncbi:MAG: AbrB/MazE/SpoVT family DNA-binding domain-containing protein [Brevundimonas sp.]|uniref:AbrB/MazE/SpoVT family DNA-binding domain-containing protein n=1 Tax=Brevundimonas sp. TaxID=1871086 RepID=UPI0027345E1C|nr:AbrB/MazE/SpoVT family DNA-binding domain-containing protein [Brevundimonas sp.]MDP3378747.1 AbrB/MazE/SpoVT family DNA-binding domain-containing protein [Brevundimonas sp.]
MIAIKLTQVGNSVGAVFPKEALNELGVTKGDTLYLTKGPDGAMRISAYSERVAGQIEAARSVMRDYRETLRALSK